MIVSPKAAEAAGRNFGTRPVCAGPYPLRRARGAGPHRGGALPGLLGCRRASTSSASPTCRSRTTPCGWPTCNPARWRSVQTDRAGRRARRCSATAACAVVPVDELGYQSITLQHRQRRRAPTRRFGRDPRVRAGLRAGDRPRRDQPGGLRGHLHRRRAQPVPPANPFHVRGFQPQPRNVARARALLREAGVTAPVPVEMIVPNNPDLRQVGEVIQAMVREAGFELQLSAMEFASAPAGGDARRVRDLPGRLVGPGRPGRQHLDLHPQPRRPERRQVQPTRRWTGCWTRRAPETDVAERRDLYRQVLRDRARPGPRAAIYLWHRKNIDDPQHAADGLRRWRTA